MYYYFLLLFSPLVNHISRFVLFPLPLMIRHIALYRAGGTTFPPTLPPYFPRDSVDGDQDNVTQSD